MDMTLLLKMLLNDSDSVFTFYFMKKKIDSKLY